MHELIIIAASSSYVDWSSMWKILAISLGAGAGLVAVYAIGLLALSASGYLRGTSAADGSDGSDAADLGDGTDLADGTGSGVAIRHNAVALIACFICLAIVIAGVAYGINEIFAK